MKEKFNIHSNSEKRISFEMDEIKGPEREELFLKRIQKIQKFLTDFENQTVRNFIKVLYETREDPTDSRCDTGTVNLGKILSKLGIPHRYKQHPETYPYFEVVNAELAQKERIERIHIFLQLNLSEEKIFRIDPTIQTILKRELGKEFIPQEIIFEQIPKEKEERDSYYKERGLEFILNEKEVRDLFLKSRPTFKINKELEGFLAMYKKG